MNLGDTLLGLLRRWYVVTAGILLAAIAGFGVWAHVGPVYQRSASQLLVPGAGTIPSQSANPYLYLGGLSQAADVVVRVVGGSKAVAEIGSQHPGTQVDVYRDPGTSGPVIAIDVTSPSDEAARQALRTVLAQTVAQLNKLQNDQGIPVKDRILTTTLTVDRQPTLDQKKRLIATVGAAIAVLALFLVVASVVDGLTRAHERRKPARRASGAQVVPDHAATEERPGTRDDTPLTAAADSGPGRGRHGTASAESPHSSAGNSPDALIVELPGRSRRTELLTPGSRQD